MQHKWELINWLIEKFNYKSCLVIGVESDECFQRINVDKKISVDPVENVDYRMTSDDFFSRNLEHFDIIFIDSLHLCEVVYRDIKNSLNILNPGGTIICHDMWPENEIECSRTPTWGQRWMGDSYKALLKIIQEHDDLWVHVLYDFDCGTTIIRKTDHNPILKKDIPDWNVDLKTWHNMAGIWAGAMTVEKYLKKSDEVVICAIAKQEQPYIRNWCKWHLDRGFDRIYIYDNNDLESTERYLWLENEFHDKVEVRQCLGLKGQQILQYQSFSDDNIYKWVAFIDIDEFINFKENTYNNIKEFLNTYPDSDAFILQWQCYHANHDISPVDIPIWEYCTEPVSDKIRKDSRPENMNGWYKTISRSGIKLGMNEHTVWANGLKVMDSLGNPVSATYFKFRDHSNDPVWINHYIIKNIKDYYYNKYLRGHAGLDMAGVDGYTWWNWNQNLNYYTDIQGYLSETEQQFLRSRGYKPNWTFRPMVNLIVHVEPGEMSWYAQRKSDLIQDINNHADVFMIMTHATSDGPNESGKYGRYAFMSSDIWHQTFDSAWMPGFPEMESYGQPIPVFNLGYDPDNLYIQHEDSDRLNVLNSSLNSWFRTSEWLTDRFRNIIENPDIMFVLKSCIEEDPECSGRKDEVENFLRSHGLELKHTFRIKNNTYITSIDIYNQLYSYWWNFISRENNNSWISTSDIISAHQNHETTDYDIWQFILPNLVPNLMIL